MGDARTAILISIFNIVFTALVGGIVIYVIQKKIDATIQKSLFEHQTRFTLGHTKAVETLEHLYKKFVVFNKVVNESIMLRRRSARDDKPWQEKGDQADVLLKEFESYYKNNRLFLPVDISESINDICLRSRYVPLIVKLALGSVKTRIRNDIRVPSPDQSLNTFVWEGRYLDTAFTESSDDGTIYKGPETVLAELLAQVTQDIQELEVMYKSIAEAK